MGSVRGGDNLSDRGDAAVVMVWDLPLRLFHWLFAATVATGIASALLGAMELHMRAGQVALALLLFRLVWGFVGPEHARFRGFVRGPRAIVAYVRSLLSPPHDFHAGHNPLGAIVVVAMLALLLVQAVSGLFANDDIVTEGPLARFVGKAVSDAISALHHRNGWLIIGVVLIHFAAVFGYLVRFRENLIGPMVTGVKILPKGVEATGIGSSRIRLAALVALPCALVAWLVFAAPGWIAPAF